MLTLQLETQVNPEAIPAGNQPRPSTDGWLRYVAVSVEDRVQYFSHLPLRRIYKGGELLRE